MSHEQIWTNKYDLYRPPYLTFSTVLSVLFVSPANFWRVLLAFLNVRIFLNFKNPMANKVASLKHMASIPCVKFNNVLRRMF